MMPIMLSCVNTVIHLLNHMFSIEFIVSVVLLDCHCLIFYHPMYVNGEDKKIQTPLNIIYNITFNPDLQQCH